MAYEPRQISFVGRDGRLKHYGIGVDGPARPELLDATASAAAEVVPEGAVAHDFERRAWLEDVRKAGDVERYLERTLADTAV